MLLMILPAAFNRRDLFSSTLQMLLQFTTRNSQLSPHPAFCSPAWSACGRTYTSCHRRACPASWRLWSSGQRTSLIRLTPVTSSVRPSLDCASWRARTPSSWYTPGLRRYVGTCRQAFTDLHRDTGIFIKKHTFLYNDYPQVLICKRLQVLVG